MRRILLFLLLGALLSSCREIVEKEAEEKMSEAKAALREEQWEVADNAFFEAILLDPERADGWIGRGMTQTQLSNEEEARTHYEEALEIYETRLKEEPDDTEALRRRIMLLVLLNRSEEAAAVTEKAAREHPNEEFAQSLPGLVETLETEFGDLILPPPEERQAASLFDSETLPEE